MLNKNVWILIVRYVCALWAVNKHKSLEEFGPARDELLLNIKQ